MRIRHATNGGKTNLENGTLILASFTQKIDQWKNNLEDGAYRHFQAFKLETTSFRHFQAFKLETTSYRHFQALKLETMSYRHFQAL